MNEKDWTMLVTLAQERSLTRTAQKLYVTQPAVTRRLQQLERELGCPIVIRGVRGIELSAEGEYLARYAQNELERLGALREYIDSRGVDVRGTLRLACGNAYARCRLPELLKRFCARYPHVDVHVVTGHSRRMGRLLTAGEAQIAIVRGRFDWAEERFALSVDPYYYVVSSAPLDLPRLPELPQIRNVTDEPLEDELHRWWTERYRTPPRVSTVVDRSDICVEMVFQGLGYSLLSGLYVPSGSPLYKERLVFANGEALRRETCACCRAASLSVRAVRAFWDFLHSESESHELDADA